MFNNSLHLSRISLRISRITRNLNSEGEGDAMYEHEGYPDATGTELFKPIWRLIQLQFLSQSGPLLFATYHGFRRLPKIDHGACRRGVFP
jgi:hypothetical protein